MSLPDGNGIVIEERSPEEVTRLWYEKPMAPPGVKVDNPAFDVTDHSLVTGIITEKGIAYPPFDRAFAGSGFAETPGDKKGGSGEMYGRSAASAPERTPRPSGAEADLQIRKDRGNIS